MPLLWKGGDIAKALYQNVLKKSRDFWGVLAGSPEGSGPIAGLQRGPSDSRKRRPHAASRPNRDADAAIQIEIGASSDRSCASQNEIWIRGRTVQLVDWSQIEK